MSGRPQQAALLDPIARARNLAGVAVDEEPDEFANPTGRRSRGRAR
jgi:hypothetical protein